MTHCSESMLYSKSSHGIYNALLEIRYMSTLLDVLMSSWEIVSSLTASSSFDECLFINFVKLPHSLFQNMIFLFVVSRSLS